MCCDSAAYWMRCFFRPADLCRLGRLAVCIFFKDCALRACTLLFWRVGRHVDVRLHVRSSGLWPCVADAQVLRQSARVGSVLGVVWTRDSGVLPVLDAVLATIGGTGLDAHFAKAQLALHKVVAVLERLHGGPGVEA